MKKYIFLILGVFMIFGSCSFFPATFRAGGIDISGPMSGHIQIVETEADNEEEFFPKPAFLVLNIEEGQDIILCSYRDPDIQEDVLLFFQDLTGSSDVAEVILANASAMDIPPALAFALAAEESGYNPDAYNRNQNDTVDRGLFQLNSASFPGLSTDDFYAPDVNARYGLSHLRWCLNHAGTEVAGLAMYNAGANRVRSTGTPKSTLDYVSRILKRQRRIESLFMAEYVRIAEERNAEIERSQNGGKTILRLSLLTPLGRK